MPHPQMSDPRFKDERLSEEPVIVPPPKAPWWVYGNLFVSVGAFFTQGALLVIFALRLSQSTNWFDWVAVVLWGLLVISAGASIVYWVRRGRA